VKYQLPSLSETSPQSPRDDKKNSDQNSLRCVDPSVAVTETTRIISTGASVVRHLSSGPYERDILGVDGTRTLIRRVVVDGAYPDTSPAQSESEPPFKIEEGFHSQFLSAAPLDWRYSRLTSTGEALFFSCPPGTLPEPRGIKGIIKLKKVVESSSSPSFSPSDDNSRKGEVDRERTFVGASNNDKSGNIMQVCVDAETLAEVRSFQDGRLIVNHCDKLREVYFPDGTKIVIHPEG
jgi:hypothetical protein